MPEQSEQPERMSAGAGQHPAAPWQWRRAVHRSEVQEWDSVYVQLPAFFRAGSCIFFGRHFLRQAFPPGKFPRPSDNSILLKGNCSERFAQQLRLKYQKNRD